MKDALILGLLGHNIRIEEGVMEEENMLVAQLIEPTERMLNLSRIQHTTTEMERLAIKSIQLSNSPDEDKLIWPSTTDGVAKPKLVSKELHS